MALRIQRPRPVYIEDELPSFLTQPSGVAVDDAPPSLHYAVNKRAVSRQSAPASSSETEAVNAPATRQVMADARLSRLLNARDVALLSGAMLALNLLLYLVFHYRPLPIIPLEELPAESIATNDAEPPIEARIFTYTNPLARQHDPD